MPFFFLLVLNIHASLVFLYKKPASIGRKLSLHNLYKEKGNGSSRKYTSLNQI